MLPEKQTERMYLLKIPVLSIMLFVFSFAQAQEKSKGKFAYEGFSGGMMIHSGYVQSGSFTLTSSDGNTVKPMQLKGLPFGIGGAARVHFGKHLRVGSEGYVSTLSYANKSYASIGWGGVLADCAWTLGRFTPFVGGTLGGGRMKNVSVLQKPEEDYLLEGNNVSYRNYSFLTCVPFIGVEYALNKKIHIMMKVDYMLNISNPQDDFLNGVRVYLGFAFCR